MTDLGLAANYLGIEIVQHELGIFLHQQSYIQKMLERFSMQNCNSAKLPIDPKLLLCKDTGTPPVDSQTYRSIVGSLLYATNTHPDICFAISFVSRYMDTPQQNHLQAAKYILCYL